MLFSSAVPLLSLVATYCNSLSIFVTCCYSLYQSLSLVITRCHSLSRIVPLVVTRCHSLSLVATRCTTPLSFYKRSWKGAFQTNEYCDWNIFYKRTCAHLELKETKNITHFLLLKAHLYSRFQCSFALWITLQSSNFCQWWNFSLIFAMLIFDSFSTNVGLTFHRYYFFRQKLSFFNISTKNVTTKNKKY